MIDFLRGAIHHEPSEVINDRQWLGTDEDGTQYVLVFEEGEFRVYRYIFDESMYVWGTEAIIRECSDYFYGFNGYLDLNTLKYTPLDITWENLDRLPSEIAEWIDANCDNNKPSGLRGGVGEFLAKYINDVKDKVYCYYK